MAKAPKTDLLREAMDKIIPVHRIEEAVKRLGVQQRRRQLDPVGLVTRMIFVGGTAEAGRLAAVLRDYYQDGHPQPARSAAYRWFDEELLALMKELVDGALDYVASMPHSLPGILQGPTDWRAFDSSTVKLPDALMPTWAGTGEYAAVKIHKEYSLGVENVVGYHIGPAREHDNLHLVVDETRRGTGLLVDLGYASHDLLRRCERFDVAYVIKGKGGWNLYVDDSVDSSSRARWKVPADWTCPDASEPLSLPEEGDLDIDITLGDEADPILARLVAFSAKGKRVVLLTNLSRETHPIDAVGMLYRLRWAIETDYKLVKSGCQLDEITAERPVAAEILIHASMLASILANAFCHASHVEDGGVGTKAPKMSRPPLHPLLVWKFVVVAATSLTDILLGDEDPRRPWEGRRKLIMSTGGDPNWRNRPSPIDEVKGRIPSRRPWKPGTKMKSVRHQGPKRSMAAK